MKKFLSVILAALVITAAGCSGSDANTTTTTTTEAATTTTTAAVEEATTTEAEATTTTAETTTTTEVAETTTVVETTEAETTPAETESDVDNPLITDEIREFIEAVRAEAPIYADFYEASSSLPVTLAFNQEADLMGTGEITTVYMELGMASFDSFYVSTDSLGSAMDIIIKDGKYYMVSAEEKTALYMEMTEDEAAEMNESMVASVKASFDPSDATFETGEEEFRGETYLFEKITADEIGEIIVYADPATKEIKYFVSQGVTMEVLVISDTIDESKFEIPADYTLIDMAEMMG